MQCSWDPMSKQLIVAVVHNRYQWSGGEDRVFEFEAGLLEAAGLRVHRFEIHNDIVNTMNRAQLAIRTLWSRQSHADFEAAFRSIEPDVVHVHNTLPLVSASVFAAARRAGAAVVQTLHNYRMICPSATLFRDGKPCEACVTQPLAISGIRHACYRNSRPATAVVAGTTFVHRTLGTYARNVDRFIALTDFARQKLIEGGLPTHQIVVKPNFTLPATEHRAAVGNAALFVGRLSEEKGIRTLLEAWKRHSDLPLLRIAGDGPLRAVAESAARSHDRITVLGELDSHEVQTEMRNAALLVFPSIWYEPFGLTIIEAFSVGLPVVASRTGSVAELVSDGETGLIFTPGDVDGLAASVRRLTTDRTLNANLGDGALRQYEDRYTPAANKDLLLRIYSDAIADRPTTPPR